MSKTFYNISKNIRWFALVLPIVYATNVVAQAPSDAPKTQYWITDQAGILDAQTEQLLTMNAETMEEETSNQVVVVTLNSLEGWSIERYGQWLGNNWGIGQANQNNGVLLLVAPNERKVRIEVGSGLETVLSNATAKSIIDNEILPKFRDGDMQAGIIAGHRAILEALGGEYRQRTDWEKFLHLLLLPFFILGKMTGLGGGRFSGGGGSFGGGGASGSW